jgi:uroporphyrinogen-III synthase
LSADLSGRRIVVTRAREDAREMIERIEGLGGSAIALPTIAIAPLEDLSELDRALDGIADYDVLIFGSKHAAEIFFERAVSRGTVLSTAIACVGAKTKAFVEARSAAEPAHIAPRAILAPEVHRAEALFEEIARACGGLKGRRFLFPRAPEGRETLIDALRSEGGLVDLISTYAIVPARKASRDEIAEIERADAYTFLSGETLRAFLAVVPEEKARAMLDLSVVAVIGPVARAKAEELGVRVDVVPRKATAEALIDALAAHLAGRSR